MFDILHVWIKERERERETGRERTFYIFVCLQMSNGDRCIVLRMSVCGRDRVKERESKERGIVLIFERERERVSVCVCVCVCVHV